MEKLKMQTKNKVEVNIETIGNLFPNTITEKLKGHDENNKPIIEKAIDFDILKQELSKVIVEGKEERYQMNWPGKKEAILRANAPINKTLRPCREDSVDFDKTENLYIEGDNLEVLKLLQETYLNKVKMIYIDPPYNTGNDSFVYPDDFSMSSEEFSEVSGQYDEDGNMNFDIRKNSESNGKFHTDWLNMMYPRLKLAKDLLSDDGVIFISISDFEMMNLRKVCDEVFGKNNFLATLIWDKNHSAQAGIFKVYHEYVIVYCKNINNIGTPKSLNEDLFEAGAMKKESGRHSMQSFKFPKGTRFDAPNGTELIGEWGGVEKVVLKEGRMISENGYLEEDVVLEAAFTQANQMKEYFYGEKENLVDSRGQRIVEFYFSSTGKIKVVKKRGVETPQTTIKYGPQGPISIELAQLFELEESPFDSPKPIDMIKDFATRFTETNEDDIIVDFFSGSATTAHAVMKLNVEYGGNRKFIMVQLPELTDEKSGAFQAGYKNICEIGKERIRRAGKKIKEENQDKADTLDTGFRVLKLDSSNMKDVFYNPSDINQDMIDNLESNIKEERSSEDLLFQVMLDLGELLSSDIEEIEIEGKKVFNVGQGNIIACFDEKITNEVVTEIAKMNPFYAVFRDSSLSNDSVATNFEQIFKTYSPNTIRKVL